VMQSQNNLLLKSAGSWRVYSAALDMVAQDLGQVWRELALG
jgi:hypothetical protein